MSSCRPPAKFRLLISMIDAQEEYFKSEVIPPFEDAENADIEVVHYGSVDSIPGALEMNRGKVALVKVPFGKSWSLVRHGLIKPLDSFLWKQELNDFGKTYMLTSLGSRDGKQYYVPRKFETRIMVYLKSRVADAVAVWRAQRAAIESTLKKFNGVGLPATYVLEDDPEKWDYYDVFVVGWIWANNSYGGRTMARVAHRGKRYSGTSLRVIDRVYQCGGDSAAVVGMKGDAVSDAFHWEAVYAAANIYNPRMWKEEWSGAGVWQGFSDGDVFLSFMTQLDCFFIHGTGRDGLKGYLGDPEDMAVASMPAGCSFELTPEGDLVRLGTKSITTGGWWWGIPSDAPDPLVSYRLARHITNTENQIQGCSRFGMIPVRRDILSDMKMLFGGGWVTAVYDASFRQLMHNKYTVVPGHLQFDEISRAYLDAWFDIVVDRNWAQDKLIPDREYIGNVLAGTYVPRVRKLIGGISKPPPAAPATEPADEAEPEKEGGDQEQEKP